MQITQSWLGKTWTTSERCLISRPRRLIRLLDQIVGQCALGKTAKAIRSDSASVSMLATSGNEERREPMTYSHYMVTTSCEVWPKIVEIRAPVGLERAELSSEVTLRAKCTRHRCQEAPGRIALTAALIPKRASLVTTTPPRGPGRRRESFRV